MDTSSLMEQILSGDNLNKTYLQVVRNKGAEGVDGMKYTELKEHLVKDGEIIKEQLRTRKYKPQPVRRVEIPKSDGGVRNLGVPTVTDRFIQQAIAQVLTPIYEEQFRPSGLKYLGFGFYFDSRAHQFKAKPHAKSVAKFKKRMKGLTCRSWGVSNSYKVEKLNQLIRGWINYFKIGSMKILCAKLDANIRYRLRMCIWKHWKTPQNRAKNLMKLGDFEKAHEILQIIEKKWHRHEAYWILKVQYCVEQKQGEELKRTLDKMKKEHIYLSSKGREDLALWIDS